MCSGVWRGILNERDRLQDLCVVYIIIIIIITADIDRLYVKRNEGGRGLVQIKGAYKAEMINTAEYLNTNYKEDQFVNIVKSHESTQPNTNSIIKKAAKSAEELSQPNEKSDAKQDGIQHIR